ncbi:unnamed protein product [Calicophoron daubneyi]
MRKLAEECDELQAFTIHHSMGGGTGSGFTSALLQQMQDEYMKRTRFEIVLFPSEALSTSTAEAYNALLGCHVPMEFVDFTVLMDNKALITLCCERLMIQRPTMTHLNRLSAQVTSGIMSPLRFQTQLSANISSILTNLVPYPEAHFVVSTLSPLQNHTARAYESLSCADITEQAFNPSNQLLSCLPNYRSVYLSSCLLYRGAVTARQVDAAVIKMKSSGRLPWVDWCPTGFKVAISHEPMTSIPESHISSSPCSLLMLHNSTMLIPTLSRLITQFETLFAHRAFIHWYTSEGMDEAEFGETIGMLSNLRDQYIQYHEYQDDTKTIFEQPKPIVGHVSNFKGPQTPSDPSTGYGQLQPPGGFPQNDEASTVNEGGGRPSTGSVVSSVHYPPSLQTRPKEIRPPIYSDVELYDESPLVHEDSAEHPTLIRGGIFNSKQSEVTDILSEDDFLLNECKPITSTETNTETVKETLSSDQNFASSDVLPKVDNSREFEHSERIVSNPDKSADSVSLKEFQNLLRKEFAELRKIIGQGSAHGDLSLIDSQFSTNKVASLAEGCGDPASTLSSFYKSTSMDSLLRRMSVSLTKTEGTMTLPNMNGPCFKRCKHTHTNKCARKKQRFKETSPGEPTATMDLTLPNLSEQTDPAINDRFSSTSSTFETSTISLGEAVGFSGGDRSLAEQSTYHTQSYSECNIEISPPLTPEAKQFGTALISL